MKLKMTEFRKAVGMSQGDLAKALGKSLRTIISWEAGDTFPNASNIWDMAVLFGTDPDTLLGWWDEHKAAEQRPLTSTEARLLADFRDLTPERRQSLLAVAADGAALSRDSAECGQDMRKAA